MRALGALILVPCLPKTHKCLNINITGRDLHTGANVLAVCFVCCFLFC